MGLKVLAALIWASWFLMFSILITPFRSSDMLANVCLSEPQYKLEVLT